MIMIPILDHEQMHYPGGAAAILHRPDPIMIVVVPFFVAELAYVKLPF
jgi:hypothetical protein